MAVAASAPAMAVLLLASLRAAPRHSRVAPRRCAARALAAFSDFSDELPSGVPSARAPSTHGDDASGDGGLEGGSGGGGELGGERWREGLKAERVARWPMPTARGAAELGAALARVCKQGDVILLSGEVGMGKSTLARGFLREYMQDPHLAVSSPSYLLDITYPDEGQALLPGVTVHHLDLWRLEPAQIAALVDLDELYSSQVALVEWPERFGDAAPPASNCLLVHIESTATFDAQKRKKPPKEKGEKGKRPADAEEGGGEYDEENRCATLSTYAGGSWTQRIEQLMTEALFSNQDELG